MISAEQAYNLSNNRTEYVIDSVMSDLDKAIKNCAVDGVSNYTYTRKMEYDNKAMRLLVMKLRILGYAVDASYRDGNLIIYLDWGYLSE